MRLDAWIFASMIKSFKNAESPSDLAATQNQSTPVKSLEKSKGGLLVYTASELLATFNGKETDFLWDNLVPRVGTGLLVGQPDLGKSQLAKELAIMISKGSTEYLGLKLKPIHNHVLYIFTEDPEEGVSSSLYKQLNKHKDLDKSRLSLAFLRDETITELINKIDAFCTETPVDLVVIDAFGDIFSGSDSNNNIQMRRDIKAFDELVRKHSISVLFVHHVNKSGYNKNPSQDIIQGGSGLTQKVRFALFLSRNEDGQKYINVAKGNYSSKYYKENRLPIDLDEETLTFEVNGEWSPIEKSNKKQKSDLSDDDLFFIFKNIGIPFNTVVSKFMEYLDVSKSTAERKIGKLLTAGKIKKIDTLYYRTEYIVTTTFNPQPLEKNEGEGDTLSLGTEEVQNTSTLNPQTLANIEGEGKEYQDLLDEINPHSVSRNELQVDTEVGSTFNPQVFLGNEGEGSSDWYNELQSTDVKVQVNDYPIDPNIQLIRDKIANTPYSEDEPFLAAIEQCYMDAPTDLTESEMSEKDFFYGLQDKYMVDGNQAKLMIQILKDMKIIRIDEDGIMRS